MDTNSRKDDNTLEKSVKQQNLKFSVEFKDGDDDNDESIDTHEHHNTTETTVTSENRSKAVHVKSEKVESNQTSRTTDEIISTNHVTRTVTDTDRTTGENKRGTITNRRNKLPTIPDNRKPKESSQPPVVSTRRSEQKWEKPGDSGDIPIQARIRGPGPARYLLPNTVGKNNADVTKRHSPAYSFGTRSWSFKSESPGPAYSFDPLLGPRGKENKPSYSFGTRIKDPVRKNETPGPGAYNTDRAPLWEKNAPQYSMSPRTNLRKIDSVPSPNSYTLPSTLGDRVPHQKGGPAVTIYGRSDKHGFAEDMAKTPGPARYGAFSPSLTKRKSPGYSVLGRNFRPDAKNSNPGPGTYNPQNVNYHLEQSPRHVIGVRHSEFVLPNITQADVVD